MQVFLRLALFLTVIGQPVLGALHSAGDGPGRAVLSIGGELIEVDGECSDWNFSKPYSAEAPFTVSIMVALDLERGTNITKLLNGSINRDGAFWALSVNGEIDQTEKGYSFAALAANLQAPNSDAVPTDVEVTCG